MLNKETLITSLKLFIITAVAAFCLAAVNKITTPIIAENNAAAEIKAQQDVLPSALEFIASEAKQPEDSTVTIEKMTVGLIKLKSLEIGPEVETYVELLKNSLTLSYTGTRR